MMELGRRHFHGTKKSDGQSELWIPKRAPTSSSHDNQLTILQQRKWDKEYVFEDRNQVKSERKQSNSRANIKAPKIDQNVGFDHVQAWRQSCQGSNTHENADRFEDEKPIKNLCLSAQALHV